MSKDWTGGSRAIYTTLGASNHAAEDRQVNDYYATDPKAIYLLLEQEKFYPCIWECACGEGHLSKPLEKLGYVVYSSDLIDRGYGTGNIDYLKVQMENINCDIITNPPYKFALEFVEHSLQIIKTGHKVAMFLKLTFLEGQKRKQFFMENPPKVVYVFSSRIKCAKNGDFASISSSAVAYAWFVFEKGYKGETIIKWI